MCSIVGQHLYLSVWCSQLLHAFWTAAGTIVGQPLLRPVSPSLFIAQPAQKSNQTNLVLFLVQPLFFSLLAPLPSQKTSRIPLPPFHCSAYHLVAVITSGFGPLRCSCLADTFQVALRRPLSAASSLRCSPWTWPTPSSPARRPTCPSSSTGRRAPASARRRPRPSPAASAGRCPSAPSPPSAGQVPPGILSLLLVKGCVGNTKLHPHLPPVHVGD